MSFNKVTMFWNLRAAQLLLDRLEKIQRRNLTTFNLSVDDFVRIQKYDEVCQLLDQRPTGSAISREALNVAIKHVSAEVIKRRLLS